MSDKFQTAADMGAFNPCLICQVAVSKGSFSNSKLCKKFITLASRYYNIDFTKNFVNSHKTLNIGQLKADSYTAQLISCDKCFHKINTFCEIYEEVSFLQIHLDVSARKITELIKLSTNRNNSTLDSENFDSFRTQFHSKVAHHFPHVKLRRLETDDVSRIENDPLYIPMENENSGDDDKSNSVQIDHNHSFTEIVSAVSPPASTQPGSELPHEAKIDQETKTSHEVSTGLQNLVVESSSISATGNAVEILKSLPHGSVLVVQGAADNAERRHKCRFCDKAFKTSKNKSSHENTHLQPYQCRFCSRRFSFRFRLTVHERTHTGMKPFKCSLCAETFREKRRCTDHVWRVHKGNAQVIEDSIHELKNNPVEFEMERAQSKTSPNSQDPGKPFKCPICHKNFGQCKELYVHQKIHSKPFNCEICGARFSFKSALEIHTRSHTGERPYLCSICFRTFSRQAVCRFHQRNVHKIPNGLIINTNAYGVKVVPENVVELPMGNKNVTTENSSENEIQGTENLQCTIVNEDNFILPDTNQEPQMDVYEGEVKIVDTQPVDPLTSLV